MESNQQKILQKSKELFLRYGVKNLTMDEIAKELGMSKKTVYMYVQNKRDLVLKVMRTYINEEAKQLTQVVKDSPNALIEMLTMVSFISNHLREFNPSVYFELQRYYPETFALYTEYREKVVLKYMVQNIESGIKQEVYRADINPEIIARVYIFATDILVDQKLFPAKKYHFVHLYKQFAEYHLRGILSKKGLQLLDKSELLKTLEQ